MNEKILIIDREPDIVKNLNALLTKEGYQVRSAPMGEAVMDIVKSEPFDLVIMDINMPEKDGLKVMRNIKKLDEEIEIIVLTGSASVYNAIQALRHNGAFDFLTKPLKSLDELTTTVKQALEKREQAVEKTRR
jgi:DNA-binding NtrC family response regulator